MYEAKNLKGLINACIATPKMFIYGWMAEAATCCVVGENQGIGLLLVNLNQATKLRQLGVRVIAIGVTDYTSTSELQTIASSNLDVYQVTSEASLTSAFVNTLIAATCPTIGWLDKS
jgi:hypothetical protein